MNPFKYLTVAFFALAVSGCGDTAEVENLKSKVLDQLSVPESAKFRRVTLLKGSRGLCGEVNSKNKRGQYLGFTAFGVGPGGEVIILNTMNLTMAKQDIKEIRELTGAMTPAEAEEIMSDVVIRDEFPHWDLCT